MEKSNTVFRKKKQRRRGRRSAPLYPLLPKSMRVRLKGRTYDTGTAVTSPIFNRYGLVEFLQRGGSYSDSLFGLYDNAIVHGCKINLRLINTSSEPIILAVCPLPYNWVSGSPTLSEILDDPGVVRATCGSNSGMDRVSITSFATTKAVCGKAYQAVRYQMDAAQAASSTPLFNNEPVWYVAISAFNALTAISYRLEVELEFNAEFYNLTSI